MFGWRLMAVKQQDTGEPVTSAGWRTAEKPEDDGVDSDESRALCDGSGWCRTLSERRTLGRAGDYLAMVLRQS
jgi:hypothetical protein